MSSFNWPPLNFAQSLNAPVTIISLSAITPNLILTNSASGGAGLISFLNTPGSGFYNFQIGNGISANTFGIYPSSTPDGTNFNTPVFTIGNTGNVTIAGTISLPTPASFTPTITFGGAAVGLTYALQSGSYYQIGKYVFFRLDVELSALGSSTGAISIGGLPVASASDFPTAVSIYAANLTGTIGGYMCSVTPASPALRIFYTNTGGNTTEFTNSVCSNSSIFRISGFYQTN